MIIVNVQRRPSRSLLPCLLLCLATLAWGSGGAQAHVDIRPLEGEPEVWQIYALVVPTETESPTTQVELRVPQEFEIEAVHHEPAWQLVTERNAAGHVTSVRWSGGTIPPSTFKELKFFAKNPAKPGVYKWIATQAYADGRSSTWNAQSRVLPAGRADAEAAAHTVARQGTTLSYLSLGLSLVTLLILLVIATRRPRY
ncbi:MAG: DUF1775 domain-containing protein [Candidatus Tectomicrobia bacterium]|nr:DUF1775 domain-containing protein [Candidatus Tectomicrobia bacterium]